MSGPKIDNARLLDAGLELMRKNGKSLTKIDSRGRSMLFRLANGETVRARTCNDHILIVVGDQADGNAKLNIEGTDWLLVVMPEVERTPGNVIAYLLPTEEVVKESRKTHLDWLATNPNTRGDNRTWNLWFRADGPAKANGYAEKWAAYKLTGAVDITSAAHGDAASAQPSTSGNIKHDVERARAAIAERAGVPVEAVKITIDFGT